MKNGFGFVVSYCVAFVLLSFLLLLCSFLIFFMNVGHFACGNLMTPGMLDDAVYELNGKELLGERWAILIEDLLQLLLLTNF